MQEITQFPTNVYFLESLIERWKVWGSLSESTLKMPEEINLSLASALPKLPKDNSGFLNGSIETVKAGIFNH
ncbi:MAG: hypothetical protein KME19_00290 [Microcoleus vaginatus WJT46-NPBG5]|jgi:hypothetical protein|nr:hypothetical protein [Microcoleus vaginatus WJT46-NPBG5]